MTLSNGDEESCCWVIDHLQEFLHGEMSEQEADAFRRHIAACESCMDEADMEAAVSRALRRRNRTVAAPMQLRTRVVQMQVSYRWQAGDR